MTRPFLVVVVACSVLLGGCVRAGQELGAGEDVGFCGGWGEIEALDEPSVESRREVARWARAVVRIIDRIDTRIEVDDEDVPRRVRTDLDTAEAAARRFRDSVERAAGDVEPAVAGFATSDWNRAATDLTDFWERKC